MYLTFGADISALTPLRSEAVRLGSTGPTAEESRGWTVCGAAAEAGVTAWLLAAEMSPPLSREQELRRGAEQARIVKRGAERRKALVRVWFKTWILAVKLGLTADKRKPQSGPVAGDSYV